MLTDLEYLASQEVCYLTTTGRVTGRPHNVEIWFALRESTIYLLSEGVVKKADWVKNVLQQPKVSITLKGEEFTGMARLVKTQEDDDALARQLLAEKYQESEDHLSQWLKNSVAIVVDLVARK